MILQANLSFLFYELLKFHKTNSMNNFPSSQWGTSDMIISLLTIPLSFPRKLYISLNLYKCRYGYLVTYNDMDFKLTVDIAILSVSVRLLDLFEVTIIRVEAIFKG